ncbi:amino acid ABC transporter permease [Nocardioides sp. Y6]|uniref:Amino acid ABC transporter permease n=1 Tax=Nocardioides malaquae TaxID=2773426 RepID=A0ABR9RUN6_9ACTN|nr:amino acid ABC transporter permease [Nocardioides malaquae]MBE7325313.1 amino acid ABC transporter permease [Nocardioides malaquae]
MSNVLYDEPGPRARRRSLIGTLVAMAVFAVILWMAYRRLDERGQFDSELWYPLINPSDEQFPVVWERLGEGLLATLTAAALAIAFSLILGTLLGVGRLMLGRVARIPFVTAIELLRGLPVIVTIFCVYAFKNYADLDISWLPGDDGLWYLVIGLTLYNSVIIAEILRAGVNSLPRGQAEAGLAIGLTSRQTMRAIQLPQAFRTMLPALISQLVVILKDTSLVAVLGFYIELLRRGNLISQVLDNAIQVLFVVALIFITLNYALSRLATWTERRLSSSRTGTPAANTVDTGLAVNQGRH